jgi:hypothetical protein
MTSHRKRKNPFTVGGESLSCTCNVFFNNPTYQRNDTALDSVKHPLLNCQLTATLT